MINKDMKKIQSFNFETGKIILNKYEIIRKLGAGWEGEVYLLKEKKTGIQKAGKFFFPHQNKNDAAVIRYAKKLNKLRHCPIIIHYLSQDKIIFKKQTITFLTSEFVEGELLSSFLKRQTGKRLGPFQALHLLYSLVQGIEDIHREKEYHGDLHPDNIMIKRFGLKFELKLLDLFNWDRDFSKPENMKDDICDMIKIFYEVLGGQKHYSKQPQIVKNICCGLKKSLILKKFRTARKLKDYLEHFEWD